MQFKSGFIIAGETRFVVFKDFFRRKSTDKLRNDKVSRDDAAKALQISIMPRK